MRKKLYLCTFKYLCCLKKRILLIVAFFVAYALAASAQTFSYRSSSGHNLGFQVISGSNVFVYTGANISYTGHVVIPGTVSYNGRTYTVTEVGPFISGPTRVTIPNTVTRIRDLAFCFCNTLTSVVIGNSVQTIGEGAFSNTKLTSVTIPNSVTSIGDEAFAYCQSLASVSLGSRVRTIGNDAFSCTKLTRVTIPNSVTSIGDDAFYSCPLTSVSLGSGVRTIGTYAFSGTKLAGVTIPNSVPSIGQGAFSSCPLTSVSLGSGVRTIGNLAFSSCTKLTSIHIPASVSSIGATPFQSCTALTSITVASGNTVYDSRDGCNAIIETATNALMQGCKNTVIPNTVTTIRQLAFCYLPLTSITIPSSVATIENRAFTSCTQLTRITVQRNTPPTINVGGSGIGYFHSFSNVPTTAEIVVPCGSAAAYRAATGWSNFSNYREYGCPCSVDARASDSTLGSVLGGGVHIDGTTATLHALPRAGAAFRGWSDHVADNPRTLSVSRDTALTALFSLQDTLYRTERDTLAAYIVHRGDTARVYLSDTLFSTTSVHDTVEDYLMHLQPDTVYLNFTRHDTLYRHVPVHDTLTATHNVHDTLWQPVVVAVHDTLHVHHHSTDTLRPVVRHTDTLHRNVPVHDTLRVAVVQYIHDTAYVNITVHDTLLASIDHLVHDTLIVNCNVHDTVLTVHSITDTLYLRHYLHDTLYLTAFVHDTLHVHHYTHDTVYITRTLYNYIHDTLFQHLEHRLHDTVFRQQCLHDTLYVERYLYHYLHDTLPVDLTHELHDTVFLARYLTDTVVRYIDHLVHDTLFGYTRLTDTLYRTHTRYANVHDTVHLYTTVTDTVYIHDTVYIAVDPHDSTEVKVYQGHGRIAVEGASGREVTLYDLSGRLLAARREESAVLTFEVPASGVYLVRVDASAPHKVAVVLNAR